MIGQQLLGFSRLLSHMARSGASPSCVASSRDNKLTRDLAPWLTSNSKTFLCERPFTPSLACPHASGRVLPEPRYAADNAARSSKVGKATDRKKNQGHQVGCVPTLGADAISSDIRLLAVVTACSEAHAVLDTLNTLRIASQVRVAFAVAAGVMLRHVGAEALCLTLLLSRVYACRRGA